MSGFRAALVAAIMAEDRCLAEERAPFLYTFIPSGPFLPLECGCPPPPPPLLRTSNPPAAPVPDSSLPAKVRIGEGEATIAQGTAPEEQLSNGPETAPLPASQAKEVHVQVDAPFVFSAKNRRESTPPAPIETVRGLPVDDPGEQPVHLDAIIQSPPPENPNSPLSKKQEHRGVFGRIGGFFSSMFH